MSILYDMNSVIEHLYDQHLKGIDDFTIEYDAEMYELLEYHLPIIPTWNRDRRIINYMLLYSRTYEERNYANKIPSNCKLVRITERNRFRFNKLHKNILVDQPQDMYPVHILAFDECEKFNILVVKPYNKGINLPIWDRCMRTYEKGAFDSVNRIYMFNN